MTLTLMFHPTDGTLIDATLSLQSTRVMVCSLVRNRTQTRHPRVRAQPLSDPVSHDKWCGGLLGGLSEQLGKVQCSPLSYLLPNSMNHLWNSLIKPLPLQLHTSRLLYLVKKADFHVISEKKSISFSYKLRCFVAHIRGCYTFISATSQPMLVWCHYFWTMVEDWSMSPDAQWLRMNDISWIFPSYRTTWRYN